MSKRHVTLDLPVTSCDVLVAGGGLTGVCAAIASAREGAELPGVAVAATLEIAYANARGAAVNADSVRTFGRDLARAIQAWTHTHDPEPQRRE